MMRRRGSSCLRGLPALSLWGPPRVLSDRSRKLPWAQCLPASSPRLPALPPCLPAAGLAALTPRCLSSVYPSGTPPAQVSIQRHHVLALLGPPLAAGSPLARQAGQAVSQLSVLLPSRYFLQLGIVAADTRLFCVSMP